MSIDLLEQRGPPLEELPIELTRAGGHEELARRSRRFEQARATEDEPLTKLRRWISDATLGAAKPASKGTA